MKLAALKKFQTIPGVGRIIAEDLWRLGLRKVSDLKGRNPETLYDRLCELQRAKVDRCMLYVMRCAVYFASTAKPKAGRLKWWNWKDRR